MSKVTKRRSKLSALADEVSDGIDRLKSQRDLLDRRLNVLGTALTETNMSAVFDFIDAVERDCGAETARELSEIRDWLLQKQHNGE